MRLALVLGTALLLTGATLTAAADDCPVAPPGEPQRTYRNSRFGYTFVYPPIFTLDPDSVPALGDGARFWTSDRRATVVVNAAPANQAQTLRDLLAEAEGDVLHNSQGEITYRRIRDNWFVISGYMMGRIFYRRTLLTGTGVVATLWMEFPREMRACLDGAVTTMSLSFRPLGLR
ncbi:hypothetical protein [Falsiroseomonas sp. HW251]|uniref:hypothetical protein n=1 Tax=Falsiroseomonas sp. HW251 TaxID=3390998 RepID=UPI003D31F273